MNREKPSRDVPNLEPDEPKRVGKRIAVIFFRTEGGGEPVREWLKGLPYSEDRKRIGGDIKTVEFGWPVGMPVCRSLRKGIYEVRKTPDSDLALALKNKAKHEKGLQ